MLRAFASSRESRAAVAARRSAFVAASAARTVLWMCLGTRRPRERLLSSWGWTGVREGGLWEGGSCWASIGTEERKIKKVGDRVGRREGE